MKAADYGKGKDDVSIQRGQKILIQDVYSWKTKWVIDKFNDLNGEIAEFLRRGGLVEEAVKIFGNYLGRHEFLGNVMLNEGIQAIWDLCAGLGTITKWDNTNARTGVGDSSAAENATQTGLQGTNKTWKAMDTGYPSRSNQTVSWRSTYGSADANYTWAEFTIVNAADDTGQNLNRKVSSQGTKVSGQTWVLTIQITLS